MRCLITGANGFLGSHLCRALLTEGNAVRALVREGSDASLTGDLSALERFQGDVTEPTSMDAALAGVEVVFHLAGIRRSPHPEDFFRVNAEGTRNVCEAMVRAGARRLVFCGSLAANGPSTAGRPKEEQDPFAPYEWYGESKAQAEQIAFSYGDRLEVTALRPARIVGPGDRENLFFFKLAGKGLSLSLGGGPRPISFVDVDDVVRMAIQLATHPSAVGQAFFCAAPQTLSLQTLFELTAQALGVKPRTVHIPAFALEGLAACADGFSSLTGRHLPLNRKLARQLLAPGWSCSTRKAQQMLGFHTRWTIADSIARSAQWYREQGLL